MRFLEYGICGDISANRVQFCKQEFGGLIWPLASRIFSEVYPEAYLDVT